MGRGNLVGEDSYKEISYMNNRGMLLQQTFIIYTGYNEQSVWWNIEYYTKENLIQKVNGKYVFGFLSIKEECKTF